MNPQLLEPGTKVTITNEYGEMHSGVYSGIEYVQGYFMLTLDAHTEDWSSHNIKFITHMKLG